MINKTARNLMSCSFIFYFLFSISYLSCDNPFFPGKNKKAENIFSVNLVTGGNGTATAAPNKAEKGTMIVISAVPKDGYKFTRWEVVEGGITLNDPDLWHTEFIMPGNNVTIMAVFEESPEPYLQMTPFDVTFPGDYFFDYTPVPVTITIHNSGQADATVTSIALGGDDAASFTLGSHLSITTIAPGGDALFTVQPKPGLSGHSPTKTYTATITVTYNGDFVTGETDVADVTFTVGRAGEPRTSPTGIAFVYIPPDNYNDPPMVQFYMGKYEITQAQWQTVMTGNNNGISATPSHFTGSSALPVDGISWYDAIVFCNRLSMSEGLEPVYRISGSTDPDDWGTAPQHDSDNDPIWDAVEEVPGSTGYQLPRRSHWRYACQTGKNTIVYINDSTGWNSANSSGMTHEVGKKLPNAWGLYDMLGNLQEWCFNWFEEPNTRTIVGGDWRHPEADSVNREPLPPHDKGYLNNLGLRIMRPYDPATDD